MRVFVLLAVTFFVLAVTSNVVNAKQKEAKNKNIKETDKKSQKNTNAKNQEVQEEKPAFEKARIRYTKPKTDTRVKDEAALKKTDKKTKTADPKNKYKQSTQEQVTKSKKLKKQDKYTKEAQQEDVVVEPKGGKDKRTKREAVVNVEKQKLKKVQREEVGVEEQSQESCPPCDCSNRDATTSHYLSNNAEEDVTTVEAETEEVVEVEETEENLHCDSLVEGCDV